MTGWDEELDATAPEAEAMEPPPDAEAVARELAKLPPLKYDQCREEESDWLPMAGWCTTATPSSTGTSGTR